MFLFIVEAFDALSLHPMRSEAIACDTTAAIHKDFNCGVADEEGATGWAL
jgi:hypothetical protein